VAQGHFTFLGYREGLVRTRVFGRPYVVLVDPFLDEVELYSTYLSEAGFLVKTFDRSGAALRSIRRHPPDAVITRIRQATGELDGLALTARLREQAELAPIPVLILTTSIDPRDHALAADLRCEAVMVLPTTPDELVARLDAELRRRRTDT
jgi:two-component system, OmpR family, alkaline phosphatase synthesis response regulator PhoP